jgi:hypothetical protein
VPRKFILDSLQNRHPQSASAPRLRIPLAPFNGRIDAFRISHVERSDGWIETTWNNVSDPGAFALAGTEEQDGGEPPPLAGAGVVVCFMG